MATAMDDWDPFDIGIDIEDHSWPVDQRNTGLDGSDLCICPQLLQSPPEAVFPSLEQPLVLDMQESGLSCSALGSLVSITHRIAQCHR